VPSAGRAAPSCRGSSSCPRASSCSCERSFRLDAQAASLLLAQRPASPRRTRRTSSDRLSIPVSRPGRCQARSCRRGQRSARPGSAR
jgi:hypothetical protein